MKKICLIVILCSIVSCATTYKNDHQYYLAIKAAMAKDQYAGAVAKIINMKKQFPDSPYLCELLPIEIAWRKDHSYDTESQEKFFLRNVKSE